MSEIKAGAVLNYVSIAVRLVTQFLLTPYIILKLGIDEYGLFMLSHTVISWLALTDLGLGVTVNKYVVTYRAKGEHERQAHFLGQSLLLYTALGFAGLLIGLVGFANLDVLFPALNPEQEQVFNILYLLTLGNFVLSFPLRPINSLPGAYQKFVVPGLVSLIASIVNASLTVLLLVWGYKSIGLTLMSVAVSITLLLWGVFYALFILKAKFKFGKPDIALYKGMFGFAVWVFLGQLMDMFYWQAGSPILAAVSGTVAVSIFSLGISFTGYFMTASTAISGVLAPRLMHMVAMDADKAALTQVMIRAGRLQLFLLSMILLGFAFLGQDFLNLWVGDSMGNNVTTVWLGAMLVLPPLVIPLTQNTGLPILQALHLHKGRSLILFYTSLLCVALGGGLSCSFGALGMFIGTAISLILGQGAMMNIYYSRCAGLYVGAFFKRTYLPILQPLLFLGACGCALSFIPVNDWGLFSLLATVYGSLCACVLFFWYLNREEKDMFLIPVKKIFRRKQ